MTLSDHSRTMVASAAAAAAAKKGERVLALEVGPILAITDAFVITSGTNARHVRTLAEAVEEGVAADTGARPRRVEGLGDATWVLLDYGDIVVHVFLDETRRYYDLERLWADAPRVAWEDLVPSRPAAGQ